jgi:hypothetical protein
LGGWSILKGNNSKIDGGKEGKHRTAASARHAGGLLQLCILLGNVVIGAGDRFSWLLSLGVYQQQSELQVKFH